MAFIFLTLIFMEHTKISGLWTKLFRTCTLSEFSVLQ